MSLKHGYAFKRDAGRIALTSGLMRRQVAFNRQTAEAKTAP